MKAMQAVEANSDFVTELQDAMITKFETKPKTKLGSSKPIKDIEVIMT